MLLNKINYFAYIHKSNALINQEKYEDAIEWYKKRIEMGGWKEEVWYSYYRIGLCYKNLEKFEHALSTWLEAYNYYPERLEGIYEIIKHYRFNSKNKLCIEFYKMIKDNLDSNVKRNEYLFLHNSVYTYKIYYEYSIFAYYCGIRNINNEVIKNIFTKVVFPLPDGPTKAMVSPALA